MKALSAKTCQNLDDQGFTSLHPEEKAELDIALRITPIVCNILVLIGLYLQSWEAFAGLFVFGLLGTFTKGGQPIDFLYNHVVSKVLKWPKLPPAPVPKRFACGIGAIFLAGAAISFYFGWIFTGYILGFLYILAAGIMAYNHFCVGSWIYHYILGR